MKKIISKDLAFIGSAIGIALLLCISSIVNGSIFSIIVSIFLLSTLCVGLGYQYSRSEAKVESKDSEEAQIDYGIILGDDNIRPVFEESEEAKEVAKSESESDSNTIIKRIMEQTLNRR